MKTGLNVIDAMTKEPITVSSNTSAYDCAQKMKNEHVGSVIVEDKGKLVGIISRKDIIAYILKLRHEDKPAD